MRKRGSVHLHPAPRLHPAPGRNSSHERAEARSAGHAPGESGNGRIGVKERSEGAHRQHPHDAIGVGTRSKARVPTGTPRKTTQRAWFFCFSFARLLPRGLPQAAAKRSEPRVSVQEYPFRQLTPCTSSYQHGVKRIPLLGGQSTHPEPSCACRVLRTTVWR
jgi:hypothetical protein